MTLILDGSSVSFHSHVLIIFCVSHSQGNAYWPRLSVCVCVCLSRAAFLHFCTYLDVTLGNGSGVCTIGRICNQCMGSIAMTTYMYVYYTIARCCSVNANWLTLMLFGQLPVKFYEVLHRTRNASKCPCTRSRVFALLWIRTTDADLQVLIFLSVVSVFCKTVWLLITGSAADRQNCESQEVSCASKGAEVKH